MEENTKVCTDEERYEIEKKCWSTGCKKNGWIHNGYGWWYCLKHWRLNYKYGCEVGLKQALKQSSISIKKLFGIK